MTCLFTVPSRTQPIQSQALPEGGNLTLSCNVSGIPSPMVSWTKVDGYMPRSHGNELVFANINRSDAGEYMCDASNQCGKASETATIYVQCKCEIYSNCLQSTLIWLAER